MSKALIIPTYVNTFTRNNYEQIDIGKKRLTIVFEKKQKIHVFLYAVISLQTLKQTIY